MNIGVSFEIQQGVSDILFQILSCINVKSFNWYNISSQDEVWDDFQSNAFFEKDFYDGETFLKHIKMKHYIISLKLQGYKDSSKFFDIHTYEEFLDSDCKIIVLIYDCEYVEIFSKDITITQSIYKNALLANFKNVKIITEENNYRTILDVR